MRTLYITSILLTGLLFTQCETLLDVDAENAVSGDVLNTEEDFETYLTGTYYNFTGISDRSSSGGELLGGDFIMIPELLSRIQNPQIVREFVWQAVLADDSYNDFINKTIFVTNGRVEANWLRAYETINQANHLIAFIDRLNGGEKDRIHGEALAIRGIIYYEMAQLWGPQYFDGTDAYISSFGLLDPTDDFPTLVIRTAPISAVSELPNLSEADVNTLGEVYAQAQSDLEAAADLLEGYGTNGTRLSYYACQAYLAKLHLQKREFAEAANYADEVITSGAYSLVSDPLLAFNNTSNSSEDIFAVQQTLANNVGDNSSGAGLTAYYSSLEESGLGVYGVWGPMLVDTSTYHNTPFFSANDVRGSAVGGTDSSTVRSDVTNYAYYRSITNDLDEIVSTTKYTSSEFVLPIVRLAEMYLIRAEADYVRLGETVTTSPINDLNEIRTRAGLPALTVADFNGNNEAFIDSLLLERTREFMHEGMLLEDVKRWGNLIGSKRTTSEQSEFDPWNAEDFADPFDETVTTKLRLPIPRSERDTWSD